MQLGSTVVGVKTKEGVVLTVEKRITSPLLVRAALRVSWQSNTPALRCPVTPSDPPALHVHFESTLCTYFSCPGLHGAPHAQTDPHLQEPRSIDKIAEIDKHIACANSGLTADSRTLIEHGRVESQSHRFTYAEPMPVESCTQSLCDLALRFSGDEEATMVRRRAPCALRCRNLKHASYAAPCVQSRPFGVALLVAGCDEGGPVLYHTDPSGTYVAYEARAIGSGSEGAQSLLQEKYSADMSLKDAEALAMSVLKQARRLRRVCSHSFFVTCPRTARKFRQQAQQHADR